MGAVRLNRAFWGVVGGVDRGSGRAQLRQVGTERLFCTKPASRLLDSGGAYA